MGMTLRDLGPDVRAIRRGISDPNPGVRRWLGLPTTMATPATVTITETQTSSITSAKQILAQPNIEGSIGPINPLLRAFGGKVQAMTGYPYFLSNEAMVSVGAGTLEVPRWCIGWNQYTVGTKFGVLGWGKGGRYRLLVDGQYMSQSLSAALPANGNPQMLEWTLPSAGFHHIELECAFNFVIGAIYVGPLDTVWPPDDPIGPRVIFVGDSFVEGEVNVPDAGFTFTCAQMLGWRDAWHSGSGGTGYVSAGARVNLQSRVVADVANNAPDVVVCLMGLNDVATVSDTPTQTALQTAAANCFHAILNVVPDCRIIACGPLSPTGSPTGGYMLSRDAIRAAALSVGGSFIDPIGGPIPYGGNDSLYVNQGWITGTGRVGTTNGSGNADLYIGPSDGTHPSVLGHPYLARRLTQGIAALMPL